MLRALATMTVFLATAATALPAWAMCQLCTAEIRLDSGLADCLLQRSADALKQAAAKGFEIVDLRDCGSRGGLPTGPQAEGAPPLDDRFVVDEAGLKCLTAQIEGLDDSALSPSRLFDLAKDCAAP